MMMKTCTLHLRWDAHYFFRKRTNDWYVKLFRPGPGQIAGEATAAYATLSLEKILEIREINPDMKIIYIMRDPIERGWSGSSKVLGKEKKRVMSDVPDEEIYARLDNVVTRARSNHVKVLDNWQSLFRKDQVFTGFYDDVAENPEDLLLRIHAFLGVTPSKEFIHQKVRRKVNASGKYKTPMPERFQIHLARQQIEQLRELDKRFGGTATKWLEGAEKVLAEDSVGLASNG